MTDEPNDGSTDRDPDGASVTAAETDTDDGVESHGSSGEADGAPGAVESDDADDGDDTEAPVRTNGGTVDDRGGRNADDGTTPTAAAYGKTATAGGTTRANATDTDFGSGSIEVGDAATVATNVSSGDEVRLVHIDPDSGQGTVLARYIGS